MASGLAITTSKSICPALTFSARSSKPTMSAPAALAASAFLPWVNTATRTVLPVPCGITVEPRTCWSDLVASTPKLTDTSTDSLNFAVANSLTSFSASSMGYDLPGGSFSFQVLVRFDYRGHVRAPPRRRPCCGRCRRWCARPLPDWPRSDPAFSAWRCPRAACARSCPPLRCSAWRCPSQCRSPWR